jgi:hypothetical protein
VTGVCDDAFTRELTTRAPRLVLAPDAVRVLRVTVSEERGRFRGALDVTDGDATTHRDMDGASCEEVLRGLALVAALTMDPEDLNGSAPVEPEPPARAAPATSAEPSEKPRLPPTAAPAPWSISLGAFAEASSLLPDPLVSAGGQISAELHRRDLVAPSLRLRVASSLPASHDSASGRATFSWMTAGVDGCPLRWGNRVAVRPCVGIDVGQLVGAGDDGGAITGSGQRRRLWAAGRLLGRLEALPAPWITLELEGGLLAPITRDSFVFKPSEDIYRPSSAAFAGIGSRVHFP